MQERCAGALAGIDVRLRGLGPVSCPRLQSPPSLAACVCSGGSSNILSEAAVLSRGAWTQSQVHQAAHLVQVSPVRATPDARTGAAGVKGTHLPAPSSRPSILSCSATSPNTCAGEISAHLEGYLQRAAGFPRASPQQTPPPACCLARVGRGLAGGSLGHHPCVPAPAGAPPKKDRARGLCAALRRSLLGLETLRSHSEKFQTLSGPSKPTGPSSTLSVPSFPPS